MNSALRRYFTQGHSAKPVLIVLLFIGLCQSIFTNIGFDEAYYWRFAQELDWGYFDHPPMVAFMISVGSSFLPGTLGVRLMTLFFSLLTYYVIWLLIPEESRNEKFSVLIFFLLLFTNPLLSVYSFITTPDVPLIFFTALYFLIIKRFEQNKSLTNSLYLGLVMAALIYSKYHGLLVILVVVASKPRLFLSPLFYLASIFGALLYVPHLMWQYQHDFISFEYHLFYRSVLFNINNVLNYFLNIFLVFNPLLFPLFLLLYFRYGRTSGIHTTTYSVFIWFFVLFFGFTAFRGHVEPQWIVVAVIPMIVYLHQYITRYTKFRKAFFILAGISAFLIVVLRIILMLPVQLKTEFHERGYAFYNEIKELSEGKPVVFTNSYTEASRYSFYTGEPTFSYNFISFRKNQFDLWDYTDFHNKDVYLVTFANLHRFKEAKMSNGERIRYEFIREMPVVNNVKVDLLEYDPIIKKGDTLVVKFKVSNPYDYDIQYNSKVRPLKYILYFFYLDKERVWGSQMVDLHLPPLKAHSSDIIEGEFHIEIDPGKYTVGMQLWPATMFPITVSKRTYPIEVN